MKVRLTKVAERHARAERTWWRKNRDEKDLFDEEIGAVCVRLAEAPKLQVYEEVRGRLIRRMHLPKTGNTVYYFVDEATETVWVVALWGQQRGRGPDLEELP